MQLAGEPHFIFGYNLKLDERSTRCLYDYSARLQPGHGMEWKIEWNGNFGME